MYDKVMMVVCKCLKLEASGITERDGLDLVLSICVYLSKSFSVFGPWFLHGPW